MKRVLIFAALLLCAPAWAGESGVSKSYSEKKMQEYLDSLTPLAHDEGKRIRIHLSPLECREFDLSQGWQHGVTIWLSGPNRNELQYRLNELLAEGWMLTKPWKGEQFVTLKRRLP